MSKQADILWSNLQKFIKNYVRNELIKGALLFVFVLLSFYIVITTLEYFYFFNTQIRTVLFYLFLLVNAGVFGLYVFVPLLRFQGYVKRMGLADAAQVLSTRIPQLKDKLLNTLELNAAELNTDLVIASIEQRADIINRNDFTAAIDFNKTRQYIKYVFGPFVLLLFVGVFTPYILKDGTQRILKHREYFEPPKPFYFNITNKDLYVVQGQNFTLNLKLSGNEIPNEVFLQTKDGRYKLEKKSNIEFFYIFENLTEGLKFKLFANEISSSEYSLKVLPKATINAFVVSLIYPKYLGKDAERLSNIGDLTVPAGTKIVWQVSASNVDTVALLSSDKDNIRLTNQSNIAFSKTVNKAFTYSLIASNKASKDSKQQLNFSVNVIEDAYPNIRAEQFSDSVSAISKQLFYNGGIGDDHGFSNLTFNYRILSKVDSSDVISLAVPFERSLLAQNFQYLFDYSQVQLKENEEIESYFEVTDNDAVHGGKKSRTTIYKAKPKTESELQKDLDKASSEIKSELKDLLEKAKKQNKVLADFQKKMHEKKDLKWEDKQNIDKLINQQRLINSKINQLEEKLKKNNEINNQLDQNPENTEKSDYIEKLLNEIKQEQKLSELLEQIKQLLDKDANKQQLDEKLDKLSKENKDITNEIDRLQELYKQLQMERKLEESIEKLDKLAEKQDQLQNKTDNAKDKNEIKNQLKEEQKQLGKEFDDIKEKLDEVKEDNKSLEKPMDMNMPGEDIKDTKESLDESEKEMEQGNQKGASKKQKESSKNMKDLSKKLSDMKSAMQQEAEEENLEGVRAVLENLVRLSFEQEGLMNTFKSINLANPQYGKFSSQQQQIKQKTLQVEDSLNMLSKRIPEMASIVNKEISTLNDNLKRSTDAIEQRDLGSTQYRQQLSMTSFNNLSLLLTELLQQMEQQEAQSKGEPKPGSASKKKKGKKPGGTMSLKQMREMQQQLNKDMQQMGQQQQNKGKMSSQEFAKLVAQQMALRNELNKLNQQNNKDGKNPLGNLDAITKQMEELAKDLANKKYNQQTQKRQKEIETRLLESEKAERQQQQSEQRQSNKAKNLQKRNPSEINQYKPTSVKVNETINLYSLPINDYYKIKSVHYFQNIIK